MIRIKAYAIREQGGTVEPFLYERALGSRDALVRITHRSIARGDIQFMDNDWGDTRFPLVPGHEIVGIVEDVGAEVADLRRDERVGVGYQQAAARGLSCGRAGRRRARSPGDPVSS
jgi:alcohol/geraniol dehydrogenase (NADP+)